MSTRFPTRLVVGFLAGSWVNDVAAQLVSGGGAPEVDYLRVGIALVFCLVLGVGALLILRRFSYGTGKKASSGVSVVGAVPLGRGSVLYVVEFDGKKLLIGSTASSLQVLAETPRQASLGDTQ